jgi:eukaryotic-like serine/threonine-protein kinase
MAASMNHPDSDDFDKTRKIESLVAGSLISHYELIRRIAVGGMGEVHLATDRLLHRDVALKLLLPGICADPEMRERFLREAQAAAALNHPNVVTIYEVGECDGRHFIAMEHVDGEPLRRLIGNEGLPVDQALDIFLQICDGVSAAHQQGIIHRDLKPANIMVTGEGRVRILDFGLAKFRALPSATQVGVRLGTVSYMSPEQAQGKDVDHRSDIFSLGVVLYQMLTGKLPFPIDDEISTLYAIVHGAHRPLLSCSPSLPLSLAQVIDRCLQKDPALRYQSVAEMASDICHPKQTARVSATARAAAPAVIALLPFTNMGASDQDYLAAGITDEITTNLAKAKDIKVISFSSSRQYKDSEKRPREIGSELGADYLLQGTILWDSSTRPPRVRLNAKLVRAADETYVWAEKYDRVAEQIFDLQSELGEKLAAQMGVALHPTEGGQTASGMTSNLDAYDHYLHGNECFLRSTSPDDQNEAIRLYEEAIRLDPGFAIAYSRLARTHLKMFWFYHDRSATRLKKAKDDLDFAQRLAPEAPETRLASGYYFYYGLMDYGKALEELRVAAEDRRSDSGLLSALGFIQRRLGLWQDALGNIKAAAQLDPRSALLAYELGNTYSWMRLYDQADKSFETAIRLAPGFVEAYSNKALNFVLRDGNCDCAKAVFERASSEFDPGLAVIEWALLDPFVAFCGNSAESASEKVAVDETEMEVYFITKARLSLLAGHDGQAKSYFDSARVTLEVKLKSEPDNPRFVSMLAIAQAGLGKRDEAISLGRKAVSFFPLEKDTVFNSVYLLNLSIACSLAGDIDAAVECLEQLFERPSQVSAALLRCSTDYAPLREHPRYRALLA